VDILSIFLFCMFFCACVAFSLFDFWVASFDGPVPFLAAWLLFFQINIVVVVYIVIVVIVIDLNEFPNFGKHFPIMILRPVTVCGLYCYGLKQYCPLKWLRPWTIFLKLYRFVLQRLLLHNNYSTELSSYHTDYIASS